jgi:hypothetical protein
MYLIITVHLYIATTTSGIVTNRDKTRCQWIGWANNLCVTNGTRQCITGIGGASIMIVHIHSNGKTRTGVNIAHPRHTLVIGGKLEFG